MREPYEPGSPLGYEPRGGWRRSGFPFSLTACLFATVWLAITAGVMVVIVPMFERIFMDFGTTLPTVTRALLEVSRWVRADYGFVYLLALPVVAGVVVGLVPEDFPVPRRRLAYGLFMLLMMATVLLVVVGLFAPMLQLITSVSGGR